MTSAGEVEQPRYRRGQPLAVRSSRRSFRPEIGAVDGPERRERKLTTTPAPQAHILIVEDDDSVRRALTLALRDEGHSVEAVGEGTSAMESFRARVPDLVLIDVMLPGSSGLDLCRTIRQTSQVPIIMVTARDDSHDVVAGLEAGADDYVTKPYVFKELAARIRAALRRTANVDDADGAMLRYPGIEISRDQGRVARDGVEIPLTRTELLLLCELAESPRRVFSRDQLLMNVWGYDYFGDGRVVDAHVRRLRKKIEPDPSNPTYVVTVRGLGYRFDPPAGDDVGA